MKTKAVYYHAGCPVCGAAEQNVAAALDPARYEVEIIHLGRDKSCLAEAERAGVKSVPALLLHGTACHIKFGASLADLKPRALRPRTIAGRRPRCPANTSRNFPVARPGVKVVAGGKRKAARSGRFVAG